MLILQNVEKKRRSIPQTWAGLLPLHRLTRPPHPTPTLENHTTQHQRPTSSTRCILLYTSHSSLLSHMLSNSIHLLAFLYKCPISLNLFIRRIALIARLLGLFLDERLRTIEFAVDCLNGSLCTIILLSMC